MLEGEVRLVPANEADIAPAIACAAAAFAADPLMHYFFSANPPAYARLQRRSSICSCEHSLGFYLRNGFVLKGEDDLGGTRLWCVLRPDPGPPA